MLRTRILTALVLGIVVVGTVFGLATPYASLVFGLIWLIGADEWARLVRLGPRGRAIHAMLFAGIVVGVLAFSPGKAVIDAWLWLAAALWLVVFVMVLRFPRPMPPPARLIGLVVLSAAWLSFWRLHGAGVNGPALILVGLLIVWFADIGAFFVGRTLGRTPLAPRVSPKKTWEGVGGGVALAMLVGALAALALDLSPALLVAIAAAMALISVVGDLGISMLKRQAGVKDAGMLLPGHGGILDRFDGVAAALPFFVLGLQFAHLLD
ncbi:MAG TPA: phosphatidate cytidylyltransferase [Gammaproteobacteria bacterium]|nr:phosphatidate cytidylyltransferase [Gammaproteobacteria bacterium]